MANWKLSLFILTAIAAVKCQIQEQLLEFRIAGSSQKSSNNSILDILSNNWLVTSFVVFRHGDRTPDQVELDLVPSWKIEDDVFFPYGKGALTLKGKQRAYRLGEYLRNLYNYDLNQLYLPDEISVRSTNFARTKMSVLAVLASLYKPHPIQTWNYELNWQPIPYDTEPLKFDDLAFFNNCLPYANLKKSVYEIPYFRNMIDDAKGLFELLSAKTGTNIRTPEDVFFLDNLLQGLENSGFIIPQWLRDVMPQIKNMTNIEYYCLTSSSDQLRLATGVLLADIVEITKAAVAGGKKPAKLHLYSAHDINVAAFLAALRVFVPHQPNYSSAVSLELRRNLETGKYTVMVVYAAEVGKPNVLPIADCGGEPLCDYDKFITLIQDLLLPRNEYKKLLTI